MSASWNDKRPMSPHLQVWRWHPAMMGSILHRASSIILFFGCFKIAIGLFCLAKTSQLPLEGLVYSPLGALGLFVFVFALVYLALAQICRELWSHGKILSPELNNKLAYVMLIVAIAVAALATYCVAGKV